MTGLSSSNISNAGALRRIAELNPSPVQRRRMTGTKERKTGRRGEAPPPAGGAKREECSRHPLQDHTTAVPTVCPRQTRQGCSCCDGCWTRTVCRGAAAHFFCLHFQARRRGSCSGGPSGAGLSQRGEVIPSLRRKPKKNRYQQRRRDVHDLMRAVSCRRKAALPEL